MNVSPLVLKSKLSLGLWGETLVLRGHVTSSLSRKLTKTRSAALTPPPPCRW